MKDTSRPHPTPSVRSAPYRKRKMTGNVSPSRGTRRAHGTVSQPLPPGQPLPHGAVDDPRRDKAQPSRAELDIPADGERRASPKTGGITNTLTRIHTITDEPSCRQSSHASALSIHANVPGPSLRLTLKSAPPHTNTFSDQIVPAPGVATTFLRSIDLPNKPPGALLPHKPFSLNPPSHRIPPLSTTDSTDKAASANGSGSGHQVNLVYKGYPFTYDLSALPDDPKSTIALLTVTKSDPGAYFLVGAHYRRTGRSKAASAVIRSLLDYLDSPSDVEKGREDALDPPASATSAATLVSPGSPCPKSIDYTRPVFKSAAMRPAMLLLAACELDISREHPDDPESAHHASTAHDLFCAIYGTVNDAIIAGVVRSQPKNALGLDFSSNRSGLPVSALPSELSIHPPRSAPPCKSEALGRVKSLEKELSAARAAQKTLQERLTASNDRLAQAEDKIHALESHSREVLVQLDTMRDENWELRQRLAESEERTRELIQCAPSAESRVWGRIKDLLFENLGGVRGA